VVPPRGSSFVGLDGGALDGGGLLGGVLAEGIPGVAVVAADEVTLLPGGRGLGEGAAGAAGVHPVTAIRPPSASSARRDAMAQRLIM